MTESEFIQLQHDVRQFVTHKPRKARWPEDLRQRVERYLASSQSSVGEVASKLGIDPHTLHYWSRTRKKKITNVDEPQPTVLRVAPDRGWELRCETASGTFTLRLS